jgi:multidrug efflux pump subunit AcrB
VIVQIGVHEKKSREFVHLLHKLTGARVDFFPRSAQTLATSVICLLGTGYLFYVIPKAFLPVGDSSFALGVFVAQEGTSPDEMHKHQEEVESVLHANPAVD